MRDVDHTAGVRRGLAGLCAPILGSICLALSAACTTGILFAATPDSNAVLGFESPSGWLISSNAAAATVGLSTTTRTQGTAALALANPGNLTKLTSLPVASTATALAGIGNPGSVLEVDVLLPFIERNPANRGWLKLFISARSVGVNHEQAGEVDFGGLRAGIYSTMQFPISDSIRSALGNSSFSDLTFEFMISSPGPGTGTYLFDNLRVHSVPLVTGHPGLQPPPGYGGSVDFVVFGGAPVAQSFPVGVLQVPDSFHLKHGAAAATSVQLAIGFEGMPSFTCAYKPDTSDPTGSSYAFESCTGGVQPGDLVGADWAQIGITGGNSSMKLRAQLAQNPMGDLVGGGILPAMPTFWGDFDSCTPAPVPGVVVTTSSTCADQTAQANQIVNAYFKKLNAAPPPPNWIVTPKPEFAQRYGDGSPNNNLVGPPPPNDPPFDQEGHMNPGGSFDAYWRLNGTITTGNSPNQTAHTDATFSGHAVLFGSDVDVVSLNATADTSTGTSPTATGSLHMYLFGLEIPGGGNADASTGFNFNISKQQDFDLPPIPIWIFSITVGATASVGVDASGTLAPTGMNLALAPNASLGAHIFGGVNVVVASGGVDARVDLLDVSTPFNVEALWSISTLPTTCSATLKFGTFANANISSGGGEVDLVATFGPCPLCDSESWTLFSWGPLASYSKPILNVSESLQAFQLPTSLCSQPLSVSIVSPVQTAAAGVVTPLIGMIRDSSGDLIDCSKYVWTVSSPDTLNPVSGQGCLVSAMFTPGTRPLGLGASVNFTDQFGRTITETGSASEMLTVSALSAGSYIVNTSPTNLDNVQPPFNGKSLAIEIPGTSGTIQFTGAVIGLGNNTCPVWTATPFSGPPILIGTGLTPTWNGAPTGTFTITMTTFDCSHPTTQLGAPAVMQVNIATTPQ